MATYRAKNGASVEDYGVELLPTIQSHMTLLTSIGVQRHIHQRYKLRVAINSEPSDVQ